MMEAWRAGTLVAVVLAASARAGEAPPGGARVTTLKVTVLSTMLAGNPGAGVGEWGFAALVEADGHRLLVDTGGRAETVLRNAAELGIDLSTVTDVVITHNHGDHTAGLVELRRELARKQPRALSRAHVAAGAFLSRLTPDGTEDNGLLPLKAAFVDLGGAFTEHPGPAQLFPGVWLTGPVPRPHPERNWSGSRRLLTPDGPAEDTVPEDASVVVAIPEGLVVVSGCGHAGMVNTLEYARQVVTKAPIHAAIGGFHLFAASDEHLAWTAGHLRTLGLAHLLGAHCTGLEAVFRIRALAGLTRRTAVVGAVGSSFTRGSGLEALALAR
jgi:7,8-dihydropterin-6-yl-methyl-4-(beta-D-ribofuranosyl)aminobenzene 5'-phosphate synthase